MINIAEPLESSLRSFQSAFGSRSPRWGRLRAQWPQRANQCSLQLPSPGHQAISANSVVP